MGAAGIIITSSAGSTVVRVNASVGREEARYVALGPSKYEDEERMMHQIYSRGLSSYMIPASSWVKLEKIK